MELRDLEYFAVVAEHGHLGRAAESLGLSQPALSKSLRRLEEAVEARLVKRIPKGVELTAEGSALLLRVRELRLSMKDIAREIGELGQGHIGHLRVGVGEAANEHLLPVAISALLKDAPRVTVKLETSDNDLMLPAVREGRLDLMVNYLSPALPEGLAQEELYQEEMVVCASTEHRLAARKNIKLADLTQERWASTESVLPGPQWLSRAFEDRGLAPPRIAVECRGVRARFQILSSSDLLAFTARSMFEQNAQTFRLVRLPVKELAWKRPVGVIHRRDAYLSPAARRLIETLRATARKLGTDHGFHFIPS